MSDRKNTDYILLNSILFKRRLRQINHLLPGTQTSKECLLVKSVTLQLGGKYIKEVIAKGQPTARTICWKWI